jgi:hypothetical protein
VDANHDVLAKTFENKINKLSIKSYIGKTTCKKKPNVFGSKILEFFGAKDPFKKYMQQNKLCKTLPFWLSKTISIQFVERISFRTPCNAFMFKNFVSIKKIVFTKGFALFGGEDETILPPT